LLLAVSRGLKRTNIRLLLLFVVRCLLARLLACLAVQPLLMLARSLRPSNAAHTPPNAKARLKQVDVQTALMRTLLTKQSAEQARSRLVVCCSVALRHARRGPWYELVR
jgi:hypothetical protein